MSFALFVLRALIGALFVGHGAQKVLGKFGGYGPDGTGQFFDSIGISPGKPMAMAAGGAEMGGGALLAAGAATPLAAASITSVMSTAIYTVHRPNGIWVDKGGFEYNLVLIAAAFAITTAGPGKISVDAARGNDQWGLPWALAALAAGLAGSAAVIASGQSGAAAQAPSGPEAQEAPSGGADTTPAPAAS
jgi:putative oxidoreductase